METGATALPKVAFRSQGRNALTPSRFDVK